MNGVLETLRPAPPPPTNSPDRVLRGLESSIFDRADLGEGDKVKLYNQILLRYNTMADKRFKQPTRVVVVNDDGTAAAAAMRDAGTTQPTASSKPLTTTGADADILESVPKSLKSKADRLMKRLKNDPTLRKRKQNDPVG